MAGKRGRPVHGWLVLDKPVGMTSSQAVGAVRRILDAQKAGHAGTLDPLADGVLPIALGEATKTVSFAMTSQKTYRFTLCFGETRDTDDCEGSVIATHAHRPKLGDIKAVLPSFVGVIEQIPPAFSALKINGKRAYELARAGLNPQMAPRKVEIFEAKLLNLPDQDHAVFEIRCGKGTYIRSLARDLARRLGTEGHVSALRRTVCGRFHEDMAISLDSLRDLGHSAAAQEQLLAVKTPLDDIPAVAVNGPDAARLKRGQEIILHVSYPLLVGGTVLCLSAKTQQPVALAEYGGGTLRPVRVFNLPTDGDHDVGYS